MKPGRKPRPNHLKILEGRTSHNPIKPKVEPVPSRPVAPQGLSKEARREWNRVVPLLDNLGVLAQVDRSELAAYCEAWSQFLEASRNVAKRGLFIKVPRFARDGALIAEVEVVNPAAQVAHQASERLRKLGAEFGMSPASRLEKQKAAGGGSSAREAKVLD